MRLLLGISNLVIIQWINISANSTGTSSVNLPISFTATNYGASKMIISTATSISAGENTGTGYLKIYRGLSDIYVRTSNGTQYTCILAGY